MAKILRPGQTIRNGKKETVKGTGWQESSLFLFSQNFISRNCKWNQYVLNKLLEDIQGLIEAVSDQKRELNDHWAKLDSRLKERCHKEERRMQKERGNQDHGKSRAYPLQIAKEDIKDAEVRTKHYFCAVHLAWIIFSDTVYPHRSWGFMSIIVHAPLFPDEKVPWDQMGVSELGEQ